MVDDCVCVAVLCDLLRGLFVDLICVYRICCEVILCGCFVSLCLIAVGLLYIDCFVFYCCSLLVVIVLIEFDYFIWCDSFGLIILFC